MIFDKKFIDSVDAETELKIRGAPREPKRPREQVV